MAGGIHTLTSGLANLARRRSRAGVDSIALSPRKPGAPAVDPAAARVRSGIAALLRGKRPLVEASPAPGPDSALFELAGAEVLEVAGERIFSIRREVADLLPDADVASDLAGALARLRGRDPEDVDPGLLPAIERELRDVVVMDLETTGFWGCPIFLVGLLFVEDGRLVTRQLLARDYAEEVLILRGAAGLLASRKLLVTFNGKSYDAPCLRERSVYHGIACGLDRLAHVDVLHPARRRWRGHFADCRLQTLERAVIGITRTGDVPSAEIPAAYHAFTANPDPEAMRPILHHGRVDLVTTAKLFAELAD
jgi:uncharacterized protein YprB with RNaseH-like and TPR domain